MPDWKQEIRQRLANLTLKPTREAEIVEELAQHLNDRYSELLAGGASDDEASTAARAELSDTLANELRKLGPEATKNPVVLGSGTSSNLLGGLWHDSRYGARMIRKNPGFTAVAVVTLALGIGANTAIFSVVDAFLWRSLPVKDPKQLVFVRAVEPKGRAIGTFPYPAFEQIRDQNSSFSSIFARDDSRVSVTVDGGPEMVWGDFVSGAYFEMLGVRSIAGRIFTPADDQPGNVAVAVISYGYWDRRFGRDAFSVKMEFVEIPGHKMWDHAYLKQRFPGLLVPDTRPGEPEERFWWGGNQEEVSIYWYSYQSRWIPVDRFEGTEAKRFAAVLFEASRHWSPEIHFNKGLAGAAAEAVERSRQTSMNPAVYRAAALLIAASGETAYPGVRGHEPRVSKGEGYKARAGAAMKIIRDATPGAGSYVNETDYFEPDWQQEFWGENYPRLLAIKRKYDPEGLFFCHHCVGSESWSSDGMCRLP